ncbi:hypothetical protein C8F01DRAFT_1236939 [Mycena amicta]|nr:hypothetical protein C8F01DRAFT_1236939 [Mycena amicta]
MASISERLAGIALTRYILTVCSAFVDWAARVLVSAAVLYFYDFLLTLQRELQFYASYQCSLHKGAFIVLRYIPMLYQSGIVLGICRDKWNRLSCRTWDAVLVSFDTIFQATYAYLISVRMWRVVNRYLAIREFTFWLAKLACPCADWLFWLGLGFWVGIKAQARQAGLSCQSVGLASQSVGLASQFSLNINRLRLKEVATASTGLSVRNLARYWLFWP